MNNYTIQTILSIVDKQGCSAPKHLPCFEVSAGSPQQAEEKARDIIGSQHIADIKVF